MYEQFPCINKGKHMQLSELEAELVAGFIGEHWQEFVESVEDVISIYALHRLAEKLGLDEQKS